MALISEKIVWVVSVPVGLIAAALSLTLAVGYEELTQWTTVTISNKNAMYFIESSLVAALGGIYANKYPRWRWGFMALGICGAVAVAYWRSTFNILGVLT